MRDDWTETTIGDVAEASWGNTTVTKKQYKESGFTAFSASGPDGFVDWFEHDEKGVVLSAIGALCGKTWLAEGKWTPIKNTIWFKSKSKVCLTDYLFLVSKTPDLWPIRGQAQPFISLGDVRLVELSMPPLAEQKRIVDLVSSVDAYIDALQQQAVTARAARNAVLHELLSAGGDGWTETTLGGIAVFYNGKAYKQDELLAAGKYRVLRVGNFFSNGNWYWSDLELDANKYCDNGDLLYAWSASFGPRIWTDEKVIYHYHIWKVEENPLLVEKKFLYYWLEDDVQRMKRDAGTGSIMMHITKGEIEARAVVLPPLGEQKRIVEIVSAMDDVIQSTEQAVTDAKNLRSGLLSDLLSGEHEIPASYDSLLGAA